MFQEPNHLDMTRIKFDGQDWKLLIRGRSFQSPHAGHLQDRFRKLRFQMLDIYRTDFANLDSTCWTFIGQISQTQSPHGGQLQDRFSKPRVHMVESYRTDLGQMIDVCHLQDRFRKLDVDNLEAIFIYRIRGSISQESSNS